MRIYKYPLSLNNTTEIILENGWKPLKVAMQGGLPMLWAEVDPNRAKQSNLIYCVLTGMDIPDEARTYLGTVEGEHGFIYHFYR